MNTVDNRPKKALADTVFIGEIVLQSKIAELVAKLLPVRGAIVLL